jgi:hypothetical protein
MDQMPIKYTSIFNCRTLQKFTQSCKFGLKTKQLATLELSGNQGQRQKNASQSLSESLLSAKQNEGGSQGCQMVCFQTKNPSLGNFWRVF